MKSRKGKKHTPQSAMKSAHYLGRLFGKCKIEIEPPQEADKFLDLEISMFMVLERASDNKLDSGDTNDMGAYGNLCTLVASECEDKEMYNLAQQWNDKVTKVRARYKQWGKWEFTKTEHAWLASCLKVLNEWLKTQSKARLARAWRVAGAVREDMLRQGRTEWLTDDPINDIGSKTWPEDLGLHPQIGLAK